MRKIRLWFIGLLSICCLQLNAQELKVPDASSLQRIEQDFGLGKIIISYSRPNLIGRKVFGGIEPYGIVWRTGANYATKIKFTDTVQMEGHELVPGEYALFTIPGANEWTVIINKTAVQWGAYSYDSAQDVLRFKIKPARLDKKLETLTIQFVNVFIDHCELQVLWENTALSLHLKTDVDGRVMANIDQAMMKSETNAFYKYRAAIYYYNHDKDMNKALVWINEFDKANPQAYNAKYWKARIELKLGDKKAAIASANEGLKLAMAEPNPEYIRLNKEVLAAANKL